MIGEQFKALCKFAIENGKKQLNPLQKELLKQAIDCARNYDQLFMVLLWYLKY